MMAGTFKLIPAFGVATVGINMYTDNAGVNQFVMPSQQIIYNILTGAVGGWAVNGALLNVNSGGPPPLPSGSVSSIFLDTTKITVDSNQPVDQSQLPVGFNVTAAVFNSSIWTGGNVTAISSCPGGNTTTPAGQGNVTANVNYTGINADLNVILGGLLSVVWTVTGSTGEFHVRSQIVTGTYGILAWQWTLSNLTHPGGPTLAGDIVRVSVAPPNTLTGVNQINLGPFQFVPPFCNQTPYYIDFLIPCPDGSQAKPCSNVPPANIPIWPPIPCSVFKAVPYCCPPGLPPKTLPVTVYNPTAFSGSVVAGAITVNSPNCTGIYSLIPGQTHDVALIGGNNTNVQIPNPFWKTGYVGG
jgi:hypothetical protein